MKKFLVSILALAFSMTAFAAIEPVNRSTNIKYDGSADEATLEKEFINVINNEGSTIAAGSVVILDATADDGASVIVDTSAGQTPICVMVSSCADNKLCQCQTYGLIDSALIDLSGGNASAGGTAFISQTTAGYMAAGTIGGTEHPVGVFYDAVTATGSAQLFLKLK